MIQSTILTPEEDDLSGLAGWMYADLLIGLMVIFLATITFVPNINLLGLSGNSNTGKPYFYTYARVLEDKPLSILVEDSQIPRLENLISDFKAKNGIGADAKIAYVQIVGSYRADLENREVGVSRALALSQQIEQRYKGIFEAASTTFNTTTTLPSNQAVIRILFSDIVSVGKG